MERHWKRHVSAEQQEALRPGGRALAARTELIAQAAEQASSSLEHLEAERAGLWRLFVIELTAGRSTVAAMVAAQLTKVNATIARITGELRESPLLQQNFTTVHFHQDPQFVSLMREIAEVLAPYDEARRAVLKVLEQLEAPPALPGVAVEALPSPATLHASANGGSLVGEGG